MYMVCVFRNCLSKPFYEIIVIILNLTSIIIHSHNLYVLSSYHTEPHLTSIIIYSPYPYALSEHLCPVAVVWLEVKNNKI